MRAAWAERSVPVRPLALVVATVAASAALAGAARADLVVGANDDAGRDSASASWFFPAMSAAGLQTNAITLRWDDREPATVPDEDDVKRALTLADANGVTVILDLYPLRSQVFTGAARCAAAEDPDPEDCGDEDKLGQFAAWTAQVARTFPAVHEFVVMNECNQPLFVNPQFDQDGFNQSAEICGRALVASYDALKAVSTQNFVWGVGLSPRGNDNPRATTNVSTSPVQFLKALGTWFRAYVAKTGRTRPLMDGFDFHPYPIPQSQPFLQGYTDIDQASVSNLPRIYQAFYDGFSGTPQRTIGQHAGGGLPVSLNEVGIQTDSTGKPGYVGTEVSANSAGGVIGQYATESYQSAWYLQMLDYVACDPNVRVVNLFHLVDEPGLAGFQSGLYYVDRSAKQSAATVHDWIATNGGGCPGGVRPWAPAGLSVVQPSPTVEKPTVPSRQRIVVAVAGRIRIFDSQSNELRRVLAPFGSAATWPIAVALDDVNRDGVLDVAVGTGSGTAPVVKLLNGKSGGLIASYSPFPRAFRGGVSVALGDVNGDRRADLITGSGPGMPAQVNVFDTSTRKLLATAPQPFQPFGSTFRGGVSVAAGDVDGDRKADVIVATGTGTTAQVKVFSGATGALLETLTPFGPSFRGGLSVAAGDLNGDGKADVIVGTGAGTPAVVRVFRNATAVKIWSFDAFSPTFLGGTSVAARDVNGDGRADLVLGAGRGGASQVKVLDGKTHALLASFLASTGSEATSVAAG